MDLLNLTPEQQQQLLNYLRIINQGNQKDKNNKNKLSFLEDPKNLSLFYNMNKNGQNPINDLLLTGSILYNDYKNTRK